MIEIKRYWFTYVALYLWLSALVLSSLVQAADGYAGSGACTSCHPEIHAAWEESDHFRAMQHATDATVLGDFRGTTVEYHGIRTRLFERDGNYFVHTLGPEETYADYRVLFTFGHHPLQQYLVATEKGRLQALNIAWDSRTAAAGGQRWFHLQPDEDITPDHAFFWTGYFSNWNSRCAVCHSTAVDIGYDPGAGQYDTTWHEPNVACEACHGPGMDHVAANGSGGFSLPSVGVSWTFGKGEVIASPIGDSSDREVNMCGGCHSRRSALGEPRPLADYHQQYALRTLAPGLYFPDGQIEDEVFVVGSFLQSKMHRAGVTCSDCHDVHSGNVKSDGNSLCAQCHLPVAFDTPSHHHHQRDGVGAMCINCHMPARTYMQVDDRRDHSFVIPRPEASERTGSPDPCADCHTDVPVGWAAAALLDWGIEEDSEHWSVINQRSRRFDGASVADLGKLSQDVGIASIVRATLLEQLGNFPSTQAADISARVLDDESPMVRRAAVSSLGMLPPDSRWTLLAPILRDEAKTVRLEAARVLASGYGGLTSRQRRMLADSLAEYRESLIVVADSPGGQLSLANLEMGLGNRSAALVAFARALEIVPDFVPALLNLADYYRGAGQEGQARSLLRRALKVAPDSAAVNHSYGLHLVRAGEHQRALAYFAEATRLADAQPRYDYVYAVALDSLGQTADAIDALVEANQTWLNQYDLLSLLILYLEKAERPSEIVAPLKVLQELAPESPQVQQWSRSYPVP